jgi:hypothetical protein
MSNKANGQPVAIVVEIKKRSIAIARQLPSGEKIKSVSYEKPKATVIPLLEQVSKIL